MQYRTLFSLGLNCWQPEGVLEVFLQHKGVGRVDSLVVLFFGVHNLVAELLIELESFVVAYLHMPAEEETFIDKHYNQRRYVKVRIMHYVMH